MNRTDRAAWRLTQKRIKALQADVEMYSGLVDKAKARGLYPDEMDVEMLFLCRQALLEERKREEEQP